MKFALTQHPNGDLYAVERNDDGAFTAIAGPLSQREAARWFAKPTPHACTPQDLEWAKTQSWRVPSGDVWEEMQTAASRRNRRTNVLAGVIVWGGIAAVVIIGIVLWQYAKSQDPRLNGSATSTPTGSYAYRNIPINQLTGADLLTMSFTERQNFVTTATQTIHCPSNVTDNDLAIGVTQAANTAAGASQKATQLLAVLLALDGCVAG